MGLHVAGVHVEARSFAVVTVLAVVFGIFAVLLGGQALATAGVLAVIGGVICLLAAVGFYLGDPDSEVDLEEPPEA